MLELAPAHNILLARIRSFGTERVSLLKAHGRVLAEPVVADRDYPPFNRATMDGYAMSFEALQRGQRRFAVQEVIFAGQAAYPVLQPGNCYQVMTGAAVPPDADIVIRREDTISEGNNVIVQEASWKQYQHVARRGEDVVAQKAIITSSVVCTPAITSLLAATGHRNVLVHRLPRVGIITTGNEVVDLGDAMNDFQIRNSNQYLLRALFTEWQIEPVICEHVIDDRDLLLQQFQRTLDLDLLVVSGAVSAGDADFVPEMLGRAGVKKLFHKLAIKPGKPVWCGEMPSGAIVLALPGNPFSTLVTYRLLVESYLRQCFGLSPFSPLRLPMLDTRTKKSTLDEFFPVQFHGDPTGVAPLAFNSSGDVLAALRADGLGWHPAASSTLYRGDVITTFRTA